MEEEYKNIGDYMKGSKRLGRMYKVRTVKVVSVIKSPYGNVEFFIDRKDRPYDSVSGDYVSAIEYLKIEDAIVEFMRNGYSDDEISKILREAEYGEVRLRKPLKIKITYRDWS